LLEDFNQLHYAFVLFTKNKKNKNKKQKTKKKKLCFVKYKENDTGHKHTQHHRKEMFKSSDF